MDKIRSMIDCAEKLAVKAAANEHPDSEQTESLANASYDLARAANQAAEAEIKTLQHMGPPKEEGLLREDHGGLSSAIAELLANSPEEGRAYALQQLATIPKLGAMVQQHLRTYLGTPDAKEDASA